MKKLIWSVIILSSVAFSAGGRAALISEGSYALDTTTGLEWLNPVLTAGDSFEQVLDGAGGWTSSGWIYATDAQFGALMTAYVGAQNLTPNDGPTGGYYAASGAYTQSSLQVVLTMGPTYAFNDTRAPVNIIQNPGLDQIGTQGYLAGTVAGTPGFGEVTAVLTESDPGQSGLTSDSPYGRWFDETVFPAYPSQGTGSFLVRAAPVVAEVPEPATVGILFAGLVTLIGVRGLRREPDFLSGN